MYGEFWQSGHISNLVINMSSFKMRGMEEVRYLVVHAEQNIDGKSIEPLFNI